VSVSLLLRTGDVTLGAILAGNNDDDSAGVANDLSQAAAGGTNATVGFDAAIKEKHVARWWLV